jgi:hypothetical protein
MMEQLLLEDRECTVKSKDDGTTVIRGQGKREATAISIAIQMRCIAIGCSNAHEHWETLSLSKFCFIKNSLAPGRGICRREAYWFLVP